MLVFHSYKYIRFVSNDVKVYNNIKIYKTLKKNSMKV
jgi:hypothetical protein